MYYTLKHLRYVEAAHRHRSIAAAAETLSVSASSISAAIDHIEVQVGRPIFERHPSRGIAITPYGKKFIAELRQFLAAQNRFDRQIGDIERELDGSARIGCFAPMAPILLPKILVDIHRQHPRLSVSILEGQIDELEAAMHEKSVDFVINYKFNLAEDMSFIPLFSGYPHVALPSDHPLASGKFVTLAQLASEPLVVLDVGPSYRYMHRLFHAVGLEPNVVYTARTTGTMRELIAAGLAYSIFNIRPMSNQTYAQGDLTRLPLAGNHEAPLAGIAINPSVALSPVAKAIIQACQEQALAGAFEAAIVRPYDPRNF